MKAKLLAGAILLASQTSHAAYVTFGFTGQVGSGFYGLPAATEFSGYYTIDTDASGTYTYLGGNPKYRYSEAIVTFELTINGQNMTSTGAGATIHVANDMRPSGSTSFYDSYEVDIDNLVGPLDLTAFRLSFSRNSSDPQQLLTDNSIQVTPPDFNLDAGGSNGTLYGTSSRSTGLYLSSLEIIANPPSLIPVPAAAWLFGSALLGLTAIKRRR